MRPIINTFTPYSRKRLTLIRERRETDLMNGAVAIPKKVKKISTTSKKRKSKPATLSPEAQAMLSGLPLELQKQMLEALNAR